MVRTDAAPRRDTGRLGLALLLLLLCACEGAPRERPHAREVPPAAAAVAIPEPSPVPTTAADLEVLRMLATMRRTLREHGPEIWDGAPYLSTPIVAWTEERRALALQVPHPPRGLPALALPAELLAELGPVYTGLPEPLAPEENFELREPLGDDDAFAFRYPVAGWGGERAETSYRERESFALVVHEMFHRFQDEWVPGDVRKLCSFPLDDLDVVGRARLEDLVLAEALVADDPVQGLADFVAVRSWRHSRRPEIRVDEDWYERIEGTARYVEARALHLAGLDETPAQALASELRDTPFSLEELGRWRHYRTGAAALVLLEAAGVEFRDPIAAGARISELAAARVGLDPAAASARLADLDRRHRYTETIARGIAATVAARRASLEARVAAFARAPGRTIRVIGDLRGFSLSARGGETARDCAVYYDAATLHLDKPGLALTIRGRPLRMPPEPGSVAVEFPSASPGAFSIDGAPAPTRDGTYPFGQLEFTAPDWAIAARQPGALKIAGDSVRIELAPAAVTLSDWQ